MRSLRVLATVYCLLGLRLWADDGMQTLPPEWEPRRVAEAKKLLEHGHAEAAEKIYRELLAAGNESGDLFLNFGMVLQKERKSAEAEVALRRAVKLAPTDAYARCLLGLACYTQAKYSDAEAVFQETVALNPRYAAPHIYLGLIAFRQGRLEAAQQHLETAVALNPKDGYAVYNLAFFFAFKRPPDLKVAHQYYRQALLLGEDRDPRLEEALGWHDEEGKIGYFPGMR